MRSSKPGKSHADLEHADLNFLTEAVAEARLAASHDDVPVGAVVVKNGTILGRGHNRREIDRDPSAHAEIQAIRDAARTLGHWNLSGCTLYVTLEPCPMCAGALVLSRIHEVVYGAEDPKGGALSLHIDLLHHPKLNHRVEARLVPVEESGLLLKEFFRVKRREKGSSGRKG